MSQQSHPALRELVMLPVLLLIAFAAWTATFLSANPGSKH